ncbi:hypothetical protein KSS87_022835, partial [Heliosperma pusillum]
MTMSVTVRSIFIFYKTDLVGSYASRNSINSLAELSTTPVRDYNGLNMYYPPGAYSYYFG